MSATITTPRSASRVDDRDAIVATLVAAFTDDPVIRWILPDPVRYLDTFPELVVAIGDPGFRAGYADRGTTCAAAVWLAPDDVLDEEAVAEVLARGTAGDHRDAVVAMLEVMEAATPDEPHWYLPFIGVDPRHQGRGHGSALLRHGLDRCDRDGLPAYLEASSPRNRVLYERYGFEVEQELRVADAPPFWAMWRQPR